jgi:DNA-binding NarL/FixJ family response regulator
MVTPAERRVLEEFVRDGADNAVIASRLQCQPATIKFHFFQLFQKAGVSNRTALALWWIRTGRYEGYEPPTLRIAA